MLFYSSLVTNGMLQYIKYTKLFCFSSRTFENRNTAFKMDLKEQPNLH